jgi:hypothetical protein
MIIRSYNSNRNGITLTEILIGIMVLGIGVISLATLFPIGLLRLKRSINSVRGTVEAENAWNEVRSRNLLAPPFGPPAEYFSRYPVVAGASWPGDGWQTSVLPLTGPGLPIVIDPLWMIQNSGRRDRYRFGMADLVNGVTGQPQPDLLPDPRVPFGEGLLRVPGFFLPGADGAPGVRGVDDDGNGIPDGLDANGNGVIDAAEFDPAELGWPGSDDVPGLSLLDAAQIFASPDDLFYGEAAEKRMTPVQEPLGGGPPYLTPFNGVPFSNGTLLRDIRYTCIAIARKISAAQGVFVHFSNGPDNKPGVAGVDDDGDGIIDNVSERGWPGSDDVMTGNTGADGRPGISGVDDDGDGTTDNITELGWPGSDDTITGLRLADYGRNGVTIAMSPPAARWHHATADDPGRDMMTGLPVPAPKGPFDVTIIVFYNRDLSAREPVYVNNDQVPPTLPTPIFLAGSEVATLVRRSDGIPFLDIPINTYIMDSTFDSRTVPGVTGLPVTGLRNGFIYRVTGKSLDASGTIMTLSLDRRAQANGFVLTVLKGAVGVFQKQVP